MKRSCLLFLVALCISGVAAPSGGDDRADVMTVALILSLRKDAVSAQSACVALGRMGRAAEPAIPDLVEALRYDQESVAKAASDALVQIGRASIPELRKALSDANFILRRRSAETLGRYGSEARRAAPDLVELLQDPQLDIQNAATQALLQIKDGAVPALTAALKMYGEGNRKIIITTLAQFGPGAVPVLLDILKKDSSPFIRLIAAEALGGIRPLDPAVVSALSEALLNLQENVRGAAADALGQIGADAKAAAGRLITVAESDKDSLVRSKASQALVRIGAARKESLAGFIAGLRDPSPEVRQKILDAMGGSDLALADALPVLETAFKDPDPGVRMKTIQVASQLAKGGAGALPVLRLAVGDPVPQVRQVAIIGLGECKESATEAAVEISRTLSDPNPALRQYAIQALGELGPAGLAGLIQALGDSYSVLSDQAAASIIKLGSEAVPALQALKTGPDPATKKKAADLLKKIQRKARSPRR